MNDVPKPLKELAAKYAARHPNDIDRAVKDSVGAFNKLDDAASYTGFLVEFCMRELVYRARVETNESIKASSDFYGGPAKVRPGRAVKDAEKKFSVYLYSIGGKSLGEITGKEAKAIEESEREIAHGHLFIASLMAWVVKQGVTDDQKVREVISEAKLKRFFDRLNKETMGRAA